MKTKSLLIVLLLIVTPGALHAEGLFQGFGVPVPVVSTGQTELIGLIIASMTFGPASTDTMVIDVSPLQITNANATDIVATAIGLSVGAVTIDTTNNLVEIPVQPTAASSGSIRIQGIRVAVAGANLNSLNARLYWLNSQNAFITGGSVPVISSVQSGLVAQVITGTPAGFTGQVYNSTATLQLAEGFPGAFSSSLQYGQTGATEIQITISDFPPGGQLILPAASAANETTATLALARGQSGTLTGNATLFYLYSSAGNSGDVAESFNINLSLSLPVPGAGLLPKIQVTLAPIGTVVPNAGLPSTAIPRYAENEITVAPAAPLIISKVVYWTGINPSLQNQVEMTNPNPQISNLTIDAFDSNGKPVSGQGVTNPVKLKLAASQSLVSAVGDLFGMAAGISTIRIQSTTPDLLAAAIASGSGVNQVVPFVSAVTSLLVPVVNQSAKLQLMNPSTSPVTGTLTLFTPMGQVVSTVPVNIAAFGSTVLALDSVFGTTLQSGYASTVFSGPVVAYESVGQSTLRAVPAPVSGPSVFVPFLARGNGFSTDLNLINPSNQALTFNAELFSGSGSLLATQPITMQPRQQITESVQQMFSQSPETGYVEIVLPQSGKAFFISYPLIAGQAEIRTSQGASAAIPLSVSQSASSYILSGANSGSGFEGIAFLNPTGSQVTVTVQALNLDGSVATTASVTLNARQLSAQLTSQLFSGSPSAPAIIHVTSSAPIALTAISGSNDLSGLITLPVM